VAPVTLTGTLTEAPAQTLDALAGCIVMTGAGFAVTLKAALAVPEKVPATPVTEYVVAEVTLVTTSGLSVEPLLQV
jgi:hypothetical protein